MSDLRDGFLRPKPEFSPVPIWWWSGDTVTLDRLCSQLDRLVDQGVHNVVVLNLAPVGPLYGSLADQPFFLSEQWWELWEGLCEHAGGTGALLWFYDQFGFSGANLQGQLVHRNPGYAGTELELGTEGEVVEVRRGFDYLSTEPCAALLDVVHGEFERRLGGYLGSVIVGSFQDELPTLPTWSSRFAAEFESRAGYSIEPSLPALWSGDDEESARLRMDYQRVRAELAEESFFRPLFDWHERHGLLLGVDQQGPSRAGEPAATVRQYADYCRTHRWFSAPGSDHHGEARIHSSLAHHYDRPRTWIESFHSSGWGGTLEETFDWLVPWLLAGATLYDPHAVYYSTRGGWYEWAPPSTCWRQPYWQHYREFADTVSRLCWLLTRGSHVCDVGVLFPSATVRAGTLLSDELTEQARRAHQCYLELVGRMVWFDAHSGVLDRCHRDFDVLDDDTVTAASVDNQALRTRHERYRAVVLPDTPILEDATADKLVEFARAGGLLISVGSERDVHPALAGLVVRVQAAEDVAAVLERLGRTVDADGPALHRVVDDRHVLVVSAAREASATAQPMLASGESWSGGLRNNGYDFDPARYRDRCVVRVQRAIGDVQQWDPQTGDVTELPVSITDTDRGVVSEIELSFDAPLAVLTWRDGLDHESGEDPANRVGANVLPLERLAESRPVQGQWECELVPRRSEHQIEQWRLQHRRDGDAEWSTTLVEHGTYGWLRGPAEDPGTQPKRPLRYSLTRGIEKDPLWVSTLGPKGRVADEFWHVDDVTAGQVIELETSLPCFRAGQVWLAVGSNGRTEVWWNEVALTPDPGGYLRLDEVTARPGPNRLRIRVFAERDGALRGSWALTTDPDGYRRPLWLAPADGSLKGSTVSAVGGFHLDELPRRGTLQLGACGPAVLSVNGRQIGVQGAFEPYGQQTRVLPWEITEALRAGENEITVRMTDVGIEPAVLVDAVLEFDDGSSRTVISEPAWKLYRGDEPVPVELPRGQLVDPRWALLWARPHPLPAAERIADAATESGYPPRADNGVLAVVPDARAGEPKPVEHFRLTIPPGAYRAQLPLLGGPPRVWVDGEGRVPEPGDVGDWSVPVTGGSTLRIATEPLDGRTEGALWGGPIRFECGVGTIEPGPWHQVGLGSYSGALRYRKVVRIDRAGDVTLDLGSVRGTAEVHVNGNLAGVRIWSPYRLDISEYVVQGENELEVLVCNTLAPWLDDASPTPFVFSGQRLSGMLGPVTIEER